MSQWLNALTPLDLPDARLVLQPSRVLEAVTGLFAARGIAPCPALNWLGADTQALALQVQRFADTDLVRLRLEPVFDNACSKLHVDNVLARLICTYRGPGSVLSGTSHPEDPFYTVPTGAPVILKGTKWREDQAPSLRHRSPRIAESGICRLVLVVEGCPLVDIIPAYDQLHSSDQV